MTSQLNVALIRKLRELLISLAYFLTLSVGVCTTRHCQTSGRLLQELNHCTVHIWKLDVCSKTIKTSDRRELDMKYVCLMNQVKALPN